MNLRTNDDEISQLEQLTTKQVKERKSLIEDIENKIHEILDGNFGHCRISVITDESGFNSIELMTEDRLGYQEIQKLEESLEMRNKWNNYTFWIPYEG